MGNILPHQIRKIHVLLPKEMKDDKEEKEAFVCQFTGNPAKRSTLDLTREQADKMIEVLDEVTDKMRRKILSICHDIGWETGTGKIDWSRLNNWLAKYGAGHKSNLNYYSRKELAVLITQLEKIQSQQYEKR